jgi:hypothetical protein
MIMAKTLTKKIIGADERQARRPADEFYVPVLIDGLVRLVL